MDILFLTKFRFPQILLNSLSLSQDLIQDTILYLVTMFFFAVIAFQTLLVLMILIIISTNQVFCKMSLNWDLSGIFLILDWDYGFFSKMTVVKCCFNHIILRVHTVNMIYDY